LEVLAQGRFDDERTDATLIVGHHANQPKDPVVRQSMKHRKLTEILVERDHDTSFVMSARKKDGVTRVGGELCAVQNVMSSRTQEGTCFGRDAGVDQELHSGLCCGSLAVLSNMGSTRS
jgi:hypothetical protein